MPNIDVFDFHYHYDASDKDWVAKTTGFLDSGEVKGILCCTNLSAGHDEFEARNRDVLDMARKYGKEKFPLLAMTHINQPGWQEHVSQWLARWPEIVGIKLHPPISKFKICPELIDPLFDFALEHNLFIASHTIPLPDMSAAAFAPSLARRREAALVIYHGSTHEESAYLAGSYKNVYVEPTWLGFFPHLFQLMRKLGGYRKMLAGTDGPMWFASFKGSPYEDLVNLTRKHIIDDEASVKGFCCENAQRFLAQFR